MGISDNEASDIFDQSPQNRSIEAILIQPLPLEPPLVFIMSFVFRGVMNWLRPAVSTPMVSHCLQAVRGMANQRHKKMLKLAKGYRGRASSCYSVAIQRVTKARQYAYRDRKVR